MFEFIAHFKSVFIVFLLSKFLYLVVQLTTAILLVSQKIHCLLFNVLYVPMFLVVSVLLGTFFIILSSG